MFQVAALSASCSAVVPRRNRKGEGQTISPWPFIILGVGLVAIFVGDLIRHLPLSLEALGLLQLGWHCQEGLLGKSIWIRMLPWFPLVEFILLIMFVFARV